MLCASVGIVIRKTSLSSQKYIVLDKQYGRIDVLVRGSSVGIGSLVQYSLEKKKALYVIGDIRILYIPISLGSIDLLFFHHVCELIYYFVPIGSCVVGLFDLLAFLYTSEHMLESVKFKKFFLLRLFTLLGIDPGLEGSIAARIGFLSRMKMHDFRNDLIDGAIEKEMDKWLWLCMWQHPYVHEFKTVHFLEKNRAV